MHIIELLKECKFSGDLDMKKDLFVSIVLIVLKFWLNRGTDKCRNEHSFGTLKMFCFVLGSTVFPAWKLIHKLSAAVGTNKQTHSIICSRDEYNGVLGGFWRETAFCCTTDQSF